MFVLLPILALASYVLALKMRVTCWREAILGGAVLWGVLLVGITEGLGAAHTLSLPGVAVAWLVALLGGGIALAVSARPRDRLAWSRPHVARVQLALLGPLTALVLVLGAITVISPPNTWDSMTYHMARLIHWTQAASLTPYPTHILRQLYLEPGAEFVLLHLRMLSGGDYLSGLVQWASMIGALIGTSLIAHDLGARTLGALCATMFTASIPIGILESTSTQNDYAVAFWLICTLVFAVRIVRCKGSTLPWAMTAAFGASVGLALLTKATAYFYAFPVLVWVTFCVVRRRHWRGFGLLVVAGVIALLLNAGFYVRNLSVFGSPVGPLDEGAPTLRYMNDGFTPPLLVSNIVRDLGVNLNATPLAAINVRTLNFVRLVHRWLGVDIADPRTTWGEEVFAEQPAGLAFDENFASNPVHLVLLVLAFGAIWPLRRRLPGITRTYAIILGAGFGLFCVVLRWQPWNTRLELSFFVLGAPLVGTLVERVNPRLALALAAALLVSMLPWVVYNQARPLVGPRSILTLSREQEYFTNRRTVRAGYLGAVSYLIQHGCAQVGFISTVDGWEYPLWPLLQGSVPGQVEIEHVNVTNVSAAQASRQDELFRPCAVLVLGPTAMSPSIQVNGNLYRPGWTQLDPQAPLEQVAVMTPDTP